MKSPKNPERVQQIRTNAHLFDTREAGVVEL